MTLVIALGAFNQGNLTEAWPQEDQNFTSWLAQPENVDLLGKALNMELEVRRWVT
jgi:hypothetical protein